MKRPFTLALTFILLACPSSGFSQDNSSPQLPDQYAEVVLRVDGMI